MSALILSGVVGVVAILVWLTARIVKGRDRWSTKLAAFASPLALTATDSRAIVY